LNIPEAPPILNNSQQDLRKAAAQVTPLQVGIEPANWKWKVIRKFIKQAFGQQLGRSSCINYLHQRALSLNDQRISDCSWTIRRSGAFTDLYSALWTGTKVKVRENIGHFSGWCMVKQHCCRTVLHAKADQIAKRTGNNISLTANGDNTLV